MSLTIREETPADHHAIHVLTKAAFAGKPYSSETEAEIIDGLREANAIRLSLVALSSGEVVGNVVFSNVTIDGVAGWVGLGPVSVKPEQQRGGIGSALIEEGLDRMRASGDIGCVLVGDSGYYSRFGFRTVPGLCYAGVPDDYVMALSFTGAVPKGTILYHPIFDGA